MKKFIIYRCPEKCSCHERLKEHVLIGVSVGNDIEDIDVINDIKSQIKDDITRSRTIFNRHSRNYKY